MLLNREFPTESLIKRGMKVGKNFNRQQGCFLDPSHCFLITIGNDVTMSIRVTVMAHDASTKQTIGYTKIGQVHIGDHVFIGANATIQPGVAIGDYAVIDACRCCQGGAVFSGFGSMQIFASLFFRNPLVFRMDSVLFIDASVFYSLSN